MELYDEHIARLIRHSLLGELSDKERFELESWRNESMEHDRLFQRILKELRISREGELFCTLDAQKAYLKFRETIRARKRRFFIRRMWKYTAVLILSLGISVAFWFLREKEIPVQIPTFVATVITPGESRAILVSADGKIHELKGDSETSEIEVEQGVIVKQEGGNLVYDSLVMTEKKEQMVMNTLKIPRGGEFKLVLSDGTMVYLNAETELKYPVHFNGAERKVFLSGEAYFQVASKNHQSFYVVTNGLQIRAYGTEFNVNTHRKESEQALLVQGEIGIQSHGDAKELKIKPGELAHWDRNKGKMEVKKVNIRPYIAWKNGYFAFENETLEEIMHTLSLWYDTNVAFASEEVKKLLFTGYMKRYDEIFDILNAMTDVVGVKFKIDGKNITVYQ